MTQLQSASSEEKIFRIAIVSDLHAYDQLGANDKTAPSYLWINNPENIPLRNPVKGLIELIRREHVTADLILCPGDLGDKARPAGIEYGWKAVHDIGKELGATYIAGTVGNHDIDSRYGYSDHDPKGYLQTLDPPFPLPTELDNDHFWSRNFVAIENSQYRLIVLNSCAFHGGKESEAHHGRVSERTREQIRHYLERSTIRPINMLLCHHHPHKQTELDLENYDEMAGGQILLELLGSSASGEWLIIHGHKHHPKISYASGTTASTPVVFSAGSLSATLYPSMASRTRNQFYIISLPYSKYDKYGLIGTFDSWDWVIGFGWQRANFCNGSLPGHGGFGFRGKMSQLLSKIDDVITSGYMAWDEFVNKVPEVEYLLPDDFVSLLKIHLPRRGIEVLCASDGHPLQIGRHV